MNIKDVLTTLCELTDPRAICEGCEVALDELGETDALEGDLSDVAPELKIRFMAGFLTGLYSLNKDLAKAATNEEEGFAARVFEGMS